MRVRIAGRVKHSFVDGPGIRYVLFMQGCPHGCKGCQNPESHNRDGGIEADTEKIIQEIMETDFIDGITLSGGDPLYNSEASLEILQAVKSKNMNTWVYTGWKFEDILNGIAGETAKKALNYIDVLVDGRFEESFTEGEHIYRGSSNQRLVDVKASMAEGKVIEFEA